MKSTSQFQLSSKHIQVDKNYAKMVGAIAFAAAIVIFCLVLSNTLVTQIKYQNKVIGLRDKAAKQLKTNVDTAGKLVVAYEAFDSAGESVIATNDKNSKIVLDALPSKYDFPALATSLEYLVQKSGLQMRGIVGSDNNAAAEQDSVAPKTIEIPFELTVSGDFTNAQKLVSNLEHSIRPFYISGMTINGSDSSLTVVIKGITYYQPGKKLEIKQTVITNGSAAAKKATTTVTGATK